MSTSFLDDDYGVLPKIDLNDDGRMISSSKSAYVEQYPKNILAFDGGICIKSKGNIWNGDLDITRDTPRLQEIATELGEDLYIFLERNYVEEKGLIKWEDALKVVRKPRRKKVKAETPETTEEAVTEVEPTELEVATTDIEAETTEVEAEPEVEAVAADIETETTEDQTEVVAETEVTADAET